MLQNDRLASCCFVLSIWYPECREYVVILCLYLMYLQWIPLLQYKTCLKISFNYHKVAYILKKFYANSAIANLISAHDQISSLRRGHKIARKSCLMNEFICLCCPIWLITTCGKLKNSPYQGLILTMLIKGKILISKLVQNRLTVSKF